MEKNKRIITFVLEVHDVDKAKMLWDYPEDNVLEKYGFKTIFIGNGDCTEEKEG